MLQCEAAAGGRWWEGIWRPGAAEQPSSRVQFPLMRVTIAPTGKRTRSCEGLGPGAACRSRSRTWSACYASVEEHMPKETREYVQVNMIGSSDNLCVFLDL